MSAITCGGACWHGGAPYCMARGPGGRWVCTLAAGHAGDHIACSGKSHAIDRWPNVGAFGSILDAHTAEIAELKDIQAELLSALCDIVACNKRTERCHDVRDFGDACEDLKEAIEKAVPLIARAKGGANESRA